MLDFRIETFLCVCRHMNFTRAAEDLNLTQPAVSQHIKYLENKYGVPLFNRYLKKLELTPAGQILLKVLETMNTDEITMVQRMHESMKKKHVITFGVTMTIGEYTIAPIISRYIKKHPDSNIHIRYGNTKTLLSYLKNGEIDFAIVEGNIESDSYNTLIFSREKYIAVASNNYVFSKPIKYLSDLTKERLITRESGSGTRAILEQNLILKNMSVSDFEYITEIENTHVIVSLLSDGCGISFLYKEAVKKELESGILKEILLEDFNVSHDFTFIWNKNSVFSEDYIDIFNEFKLYADTEK